MPFKPTIAKKPAPVAAPEPDLGFRAKQKARKEAKSKAREENSKRRKS